MRPLFDPKGKEGLASLVMALLSEGAGERDAQAFARDLNDYGVRLSFAAGRDQLYGNLDFVSKHGKPLFVALPFDEALLHAGVNVALADKLVQSGELSVGAGAKLAAMPYAAYLQHLGSTGYSMLGAADLDDELASLEQVKTAI